MTGTTLKEETTMAASSSTSKDDPVGSLPPLTEPKTTAKKPTAPIVENTNRVKASHVEDTIEDFQRLSKGKRPTRSTTIGKADPIRDLCIFVAIMAFLILMGVKFDNFQSQSETDVTTSQGGLGKVQKMKKALSLVLEKHMDRNPERQDCDLFLSKSTIPVSGFGIFAGRNYTTGEEIMILGYPSLPVATEQSTTIWISPPSLLFKHHPTMSNIKLSQPIWSDEQHTSQPSDDHSPPIVVQAAKSIMKGEELFLTLEQHVHSRLPEWFDQVIPTMEDYTEADYLIHEARHTFRGPLSSRARNTHKRDQAGVVSLALRMIQGIVARYRPATAKLMQVALESILSYNGKANQVTSLYMSLKNHTLEKLRRQGLCLSDVGTGRWNMAVTVTRNITKGNRVYPLPLFVRHKPEARSQQQSCSNDNVDNGSEELCPNLPILLSNSCWSRPDIRVEICPLHPFTNMNIVEAGTTIDATVKLQWTNWTDATKLKDVNLAKWQQQKKSPLELMLVLDLVATRDLQKGDEVTLSLERDKATGQWIVPSELISKTKLGA